MKKITSIILAAFMIVSVMTLFSCKKQETPAELVNGAIEKLYEQNSMDIQTKAELSMNIMGFEISLPVDVRVAIADLKSENTTVSMNLGMSLMGEESTFDIYSDSEWSYITEDGESYKEKVSDTTDSTDKSELYDFITNKIVYPDEVFEGAEIIENEDGSKTVEFALSDKVSAELYDPMINKALDILKSQSDGEYDEFSEIDMEIKNVRVKVTVEDGALKEYDIALDVKITMENTVSFNMSASVETDYIAFGDDVVITPPEGYEDYPLKKSAEEIVNGVIDELNTADYYNGNMTMALYLFEGAEPVVIRSDIAVNNVQSESPDTSMQVCIGTFDDYGTGIDIYTDGAEWMYVASDEQSYKRKLDDEDMYSYILDTFTSAESFPAEVFDGVDNIKNDDGSSTAWLTVPAETSAEMYSELIRLAKHLSFIDADDFTVSDTEAIIVIYNDEIISYSIDFDLSDGETEFTVSTTLSYTVYDTELELTPPEGYLDFPEYSEY